MPTPVPIDRKPKSRTPRPRPFQRSPTAARFTSFSTPTRAPSSPCSASTRPWRPQPGRLGARVTAPRVGSNTPGLPTVTWTTWSQPMPASSARPRAIAPICPIRARALETLARSWRRATIVPVTSATAARSQRRPTSMPATQPASGFSSYSTALGPRPPLERPTARTSSPSSRAARPSETVGLDRPLSRATWARETGPRRWISSRMVRALIARSRLGVPASGRSNTAPTPV
jgi:hypothetical protein